LRLSQIRGGLVRETIRPNTTHSEMESSRGASSVINT